ncbi:MAG TPA: tetratricopeptide repeat protein [Candidatus Polarisedimenticolaceae bacterium]|nr:tetratricopeptide repeat protein [Candidatus Polarisedimenticolaceae bacterium]
MWVRSCVLVAAAAILSHLPALRNGFTWDDPLLVAQNAVVSGERWGSIVASPYHVGPLQPVPTGLYRPLTIFTLTVDHAAAGGAPLPFHAGNLLLHAGVSVLVLALGWRLALPAPAPLLGALLFAVHPAPAEAVASVAGRADLLAAGAALLALLCVGRPLVFGALLLASLLAKETALLLPAAALVAPGLPRGRQRRSFAAGIGAVLLYLAARWAVLGALVLPETRGTYVENPLGGLPPLERTLAACVGTLRALRLLLFPRFLSPDYGWAQTGAVVPGEGLLALVLLLALSAGAFLLARRARAAALLLTVAALSWLLVSNLVLVIGTAFGERLLYLPLAPLALLAGWGVARIGSSRLRPLALGAFALALLLLAARAWTASAAWRDDATLCRAALAATPRSIKVLGNLAVEEAAAGRREQARALLDRALALAPDVPALLLNRASLALLEGDLPGAARRLDAVLSAHPDEPAALLLRAQVAEARGDLEGAERALTRAAALRPGWPEPVRYLERIRKARRASSESGSAVPGS